MAEPNMRTVTAAGIDLIVVELCDRRQGLGDPLLEWCFQSELENYLYSNWQTRGSFFKLLSRAGADGQSLCLRRKAVDEGLVTDAEFIGMRNAINRAARVFTVVPLAAIKLALTTYGRSPKSEALADALDLEPFEEEEEECEEGDEEGEEEEKEDGADGAADSGAAGPSHPDGGDDPHSERCPSTDEEVDPPNTDAAGSVSGKAPRTASHALTEIPVELEVELSALEEWRTSPINQNRKGEWPTSRPTTSARTSFGCLAGWFTRRSSLGPPSDGRALPPAWLLYRLPNSESAKGQGRTPRISVLTRTRSMYYLNPCTLHFASSDGPPSTQRN
jgi:hypothetical protein